VYQTFCSALFGFVTKHGSVRQTDGQNYDSQDCASIAAWRGKTSNVLTRVLLLDRGVIYKTDARDAWC